MKKLLLSLTSLTLVAGITAGFILSQPKENSTVNAQSFEEVAKTAPKALEVPELEEVPIVTTANLEAPTEPLNEVLEPVTYEDTWMKTFLKVQSMQKGQLLQNQDAKITSLITNKFTTKPELYTESELDNTINKCISYLETFTEFRFLNLAFAKNDCGL